MGTLHPISHLNRHQTKKITATITRTSLLLFADLACQASLEPSCNPHWYEGWSHEQEGVLCLRTVCAVHLIIFTEAEIASQKHAYLQQQRPLRRPATHIGEKGWFYRNSQPRSSLLNHLFLCLRQNTVLTALLSCRRLKPKSCIPFQRPCVARALVFETGKSPKS